FFQAEDGIRDFHVTGVQTCALPICRRHDRTLQARLDEAALIRAIAAAEREARERRARMEAVRAQPWKQALDARISPCRRCGGWCWDGTCRGDCKTLNPIIKESK